MRTKRVLALVISLIGCVVIIVLTCTGQADILLGNPDTARRRSTSGNRATPFPITGRSTPRTAALKINWVSPLIGTPGRELTVQARLNALEPVEYEWSFGEAAEPATSTAEQPSIILGGIGEYRGSLKVTSGNQSDRTSFTISVREESPYWHHLAGTTTPEVWQHVAMDSTGGVVAAGIHTAAVGGRTSLVISRYTQVGEHLWTRVWSGRDHAARTNCKRVLVDAEDNIHLFGNLFSNNENNAAQCWVYSPDGRLLRSGSWHSPGGMLVSSAALGPGGDIYITGSVVKSEPAGGPRRDDALTARLDLDGNLIWSRAWGGEQGRNGGQCIALDHSGNIWVAGKTESFGQYTEEYGFTEDLCLLKYDPAGNLLVQTTYASDWDSNVHNSNRFEDSSCGLIVSEAGEVYITGCRMGYQRDGTEALLLKYDSSGRLMVDILVSSLGYTPGLAFDWDGNLWLAGNGHDYSNRNGPDPTCLVKLSPGLEFLGGWIWEGGRAGLTNICFAGNEFAACGGAEDLAGCWKPISRFNTLAPFSGTRKPAGRLSEVLLEFSSLDCEEHSLEFKRDTPAGQRDMLLIRSNTAHLPPG